MSAPFEAAPTMTRTRGAIEWVEVSNYRSLGDEVRVEFGDLTALVGPNGAGKSNVLDILRFLREALSLGLEPAITKRLGIARLRRDSPSKPRSVKIGVGVRAGDRYDYRFQLDAAPHGTYRVAKEELTSSGPGRAVSRLLVVRGGAGVVAPEGLAPATSVVDLALPSIAAHPSVRPFVDVLRGLRVHSIFPRELSAPQAVGTRPPLDDTGSNWCAALKALPSAAQIELVDAMGHVTGDISGTRVDTSGGFYVAEFAHKVSGVTRWFNAAQESDGTLRLAGILTALLQDPAPPFLGIEEPELTINPGLLPLVYDHLVAASERTQIVFTTHSPELLDLVDIDDVRVVTRRDGVTFIHKVGEAERSIVRDALATPGELLRTGGFTAAGDDLDLLALAQEA